MQELRHQHELRHLIDRSLRMIDRGEMSWHDAAHWFDACHVPFSVTCRVLSPYARR